VPFESAYGRLSREAAFVFRQAAIAEGIEISVAAVPEAQNLPEHVTRTSLDALADIHVVEAVASPVSSAMIP
jgi:hypothetical protein